MEYLSDLNKEQRQAVEAGDGPILVIAGAGSGKTRTLAYRVAHLIHQGIRPERILLLTFTRRAAESMLRRAQAVLESGLEISAAGSGFGKIWGGTFHATANRLLRRYAKAIGMSRDFTVLDEGDSRNLMDMAKQGIVKDKEKKRFPRKGTLMGIYSRVVNSGKGPSVLKKIVEENYPWVEEHLDKLKGIFKAYVVLKQERNLMDYDDLLLFWLELLKVPELAEKLEGQFDHILVDEYQDTNPIQAQILQGMRRKNHNIMVVGDDAQSIYSFRAATVRNILDFPKQFPGCRTVTLTQNYRSVQPILDITNAIIEQARERFTKELWSDRKSAQKPYLVTCRDEREQTNFVVDEIINYHQEDEVDLKKQAVLFRAGYLSADLELELARRNIPFHKYGGLRYLEAAHVKDMLGFLRALENPGDDLAWFRILCLVSGIGPKTAQKIYRDFRSAGDQCGALTKMDVPAKSKEQFKGLSSVLARLASDKKRPLPEEIRAIRTYYNTIIADHYDNPEARKRDLDQLEVIAQRYKSRQNFLTSLALDPPSSTSDFAADPTLDEDHLILSTIHSSKGLEFDVVYVIHAADGFIPSDLATKSDEEIEEERRLLYVAMTRARNFLYVSFPLRYYNRPFGTGDTHNYAQLTRFIPPDFYGQFERVKMFQDYVSDEFMEEMDIQQRIRDQW